MNPVIAIIHNPVGENATEDERDVLDQAEEIAESLAILGHQPTVLPFVSDPAALKRKLAEIAPGCIFNLVETVEGDSQLQILAPALYDHLRIPYTGATTEALFLTTHKVMAKRLMALSGIPTAEWLTLGEHSLIPPVYPGRYIIKAICEEASVGLDAEAIVSVKNEAALIARLRARQQQIGKPCFAERFIEGREFNLSVLGQPEGGEVMPAAEMLFDYPPGLPKIMDYKAKWVEGTPEYEGTQRTFDLKPEDDALVEKLRQVAQRCWDVFHLRGYARVDLRVDAQGNPYVMEINANPCLTPGSGFPVACERRGLPYPAMIQRILADTLNREGAR